MLSAFFNSSTTFGWAISIVGSIIMLFLLRGFWPGPLPKPRKLVTPGWAAIGHLLDLEAAIRDGHYSELKMKAWIHAPRQPGKQPAWEGDERKEFETALRGVVARMERKEWVTATIIQFRTIVWTATAEDIALLKS